MAEVADPAGQQAAEAAQRAALDAQQAGQAETLLQGARQTGSYELPNGVTVSHSVTADGMKEVRTTPAGRPGPRRPEDVHPSYAQYLDKSRTALPPQVERPGWFRRMVASIGRSATRR